MKRLFVFIFFIILTIKVYTFNLFYLSDDTVIARVGDINITLLDFKIYTLGYKSIKIWNENIVADLLNIMIMDLLFKTACENENIYISESSLTFYAQRFFLDRSISIENQEEIKVYFEMNDPYFNMEDFIVKSTYNLYKIKYLSEKGEISNFKSYLIYFSNKNMNNKQKELLKEKVFSVVYDIMDGKTTFEYFVKKYSEDERSRQKGGDVGLVTYERYKKIFSKKEFDKILKAGLFTPVVATGKDGFYIFMHYDYELKDEKEVVQRILSDLIKRYRVIKMIDFKSNNKK